MKHSKAYPYLKALFDGLKEAAPNWAKAPAVFLSSLGEQLIKQGEEENKQLESEIKSIPEKELCEFVKSYGYDQKNDIKQICNTVKNIPDILQTVKKGFANSHEEHEEFKRLLLEKQPPVNFYKYIPASISTFTGRENDLTELHKLLEEKGAVLLLNGLGGTGKTSVALEYVKRNRDNYNSIIWLNYLDSFESSFLICNEFFGFKGTGKEVYDSIIKELSVYDGNNLLIIDNFHDIKEITPLRNLLSRLPNFKILITSREEIPYDFVITQTLDSLPHDDAVKLFSTHYKKPYDSEILKNLFELIGYHTLTIELVAKTLRTSMKMVTLKDIYNIFKDKKFDKLEGEYEAHLDYKDRAFQINTYLEEVFKISDIPEEQINILKQFAVLPAVEIDEEIIPGMLCGDKSLYHSFRDNILGLINAGWLIHTEKGIKCHQVIQQLIIKNEKPAYENAKQVVNYICGQLYAEPGENPLDKARWIEFAVPLLENLGEENEQLAALSNNLALIYKDLGDLKQALKFTEKSLKINEKILPADHPSLATSYNNLALIYKDLGDLEQALKFAEKDAGISEKILPVDHPSLATSYNNLALIYLDLGDLEKALEYKLKSLAIEEKVFDDNHPQLGSSYNNLAQIYQDLGNLDQALKFTEKSLKIREKILPADHPDLATSYNNLAQIYQDLGDLDQALKFTEKSFKIREKILPPDHPSLAESYNNLALIYRDLGDLEQALKFSEKSLKIKEKILPADHPSLATSYNNLALIYKDLGDLDQALKFSLKDVAICEKKLPENHPDRIIAYNTITFIYRALGNNEKAVEYENKSGTNHSNK